MPSRLRSLPGNSAPSRTFTRSWTSTVSAVPYIITFVLVQYYVPPMAAINKDFLRLVFTGEKQLFKKPNVRFVAVSHWDELAVKNLWPTMRQDKAFNMYF